MGIPVTDEENQRLGHSVAAAKQGIFQVVISRICMAIPAMGEAQAPGGGCRGASPGALSTLGAVTLGGVGGAVKGDPSLPGIPMFTSLTPSFAALLSLQPFPP